MNYLELGGIEYNCVFARDISERKRAEEALEQKPAALEADVRQHEQRGGRLGGVDGGADFLIKEFNPAATRTTHVAEADAVGRKVTEVFPGVKTLVCSTSTSVSRAPGRQSTIP